MMTIPEPPLAPVLLSYHHHHQAPALRPAPPPPAASVTTRAPAVLMVLDGCSHHLLPSLPEEYPLPASPPAIECG